MRSGLKVGAFFLAFQAVAQTPAGQLWEQLKEKRRALVSLHQEFVASHTSKTDQASQSAKRELAIDMAPGVWREKSVSGSGNYIRIFDGQNILRMEDGGTEFVRIKPEGKEEPQPAPYASPNTDWSKATQVERRPCMIPGMNHDCVVLKAPMRSGADVALIDVETGVMLSRQTSQVEKTSNGTSYLSLNLFSSKRMAYGKPAESGLFKLPDGVEEVKSLSSWSPAKFKKEMTGQPAPALELTDIEHRPVSLAAAKGKTVLLDFWTTWCPPCRADAPALDKLYAKYHQSDLEIIGISVSEDRPIVEKFLKEHPHSFPVALTTENEMPRPYQVSAFPTYIVIDRDGTIAAVMTGDQGLSQLRKQLKKAGLEL